MLKEIREWWASIEKAASIAQSYRILAQRTNLLEHLIREIRKLLKTGEVTP